ncbi:YtxH domain-containing protein [Subsaximicrobium wynnwilliamsii]|uniref:YtxH domain-containing protein n=1 Tax=Subsaximicrobium wynnwilliamsii TaxID=291179 RepID=A0A5C6ZK22_9FLAO|nr:YtxH domain-containing protein [Subsaximicrobium wynnwilliamsii]TXD84461.1 YtxH domain-containing protein [Subsaximicrobium wynnwilliamsii]TXD90142.1 YtxH domain-containing protein [Subsaximicrobium wynnwilliamsii]TXE04194.1 YtxH domain-containing protein [Subsaximicrobium wynnwilliamsii]
MENNNGNLLISFLTGAVIGAAVGILYAPYKGSKTRGKIKHGVTDTAHDISERLKHAKNDLSKSAHDQKKAFDKKLEATISKMNYKAEDLISALEGKLEDLKNKNA